MECMNDIMETTHSIKEFSEYDFQFHTKIIDYLENEQFFKCIRHVHVPHETAGRTLPCT